MQPHRRHKPGATADRSPTGGGAHESAQGELNLALSLAG
jgi:hypothetical protein